METSNNLSGDAGVVYRFKVGLIEHADGGGVITRCQHIMITASRPGEQTGVMVEAIGAKEEELSDLVFLTRMVKTAIEVLPGMLSEQELKEANPAYVET